MPDLAVASSNRMGAGAVTCCARASAEESRNISNNFKLVSSCALGAGSGQVRRGGRFQQDLRNGILRGSLRSGVASNADALLAAAHPEISGFALHTIAGSIEQFELHRLLARNLNKEGTIALYWSGPQQPGMS